MPTNVPLYQHWQDIYSRRWQIFSIAGIAAAVAYFASHALTPIYEAKARFYLVEQAQPKPFLSGDQSQILLLPTPDEKTSSLNIGILRGQDLMQTLADQSGRNRADLTRAIDLVVSGEFMLDVYVRDADPVAAADIANRVPEIYRVFHERSMRGRAERRTEALDARLGELERTLAAARDERAKLLATVGTTGAGALLSEKAARRESLSARLREQTIELERARAEHAALANALEDERALYRPGEMILTSPEIERQSALLSELTIRLAGLTEGPSGPTRRSLETQIEEVRDSIKAETERLLSSYSKPKESLYEDLRGKLVDQTVTLVALEAAQEAVEDELTSVGRDLGASASRSTELAGLEARIQELEAEVISTRQSRDEAALQSEHAEPPIVEVSRAHPPDRPVFPLPVLNAIVSALTGLILGVYAALIIAYAGRLRRRRIAEAVQQLRLDEYERELLRNAAHTGRVHV